MILTRLLCVFLLVLEIRGCGFAWSATCRIGIDGGRVGEGGGAVAGGAGCMHNEEEAGSRRWEEESIPWQVWIINNKL